MTQSTASGDNEDTPTPLHVEAWRDALRDVALAYPESHEDHPWGETAFKVRKKAFVFASCSGRGMNVTCKLPISHELALMLDFTDPTGYGLGRHGWVSAHFPHDGGEPPFPLLREWIDESYRAVAPKTLVKKLVALSAE